MKKTISICLAFYVLCLVAKLYAADRIVAVVNREIITQSEISNFARFLRMQLATRYKGKELEEKFEEMLPDVLNRLIEDRLILQEAKKAKIKVDEARVKSRIEQIKKGYPSEKEFLDDLIRNGLTLGDIENKVREQLMMFEIVDTKIRSKIRIRPQEVTEFYEQHKEEFSQPIKRSVIAIVTEDQVKAGQALEELKKGTDFLTTASMFNLEINDLGEISPGQLRKEIDQAISLLQAGEVSDIVKLEDKFYIFKLKAITAGRELTIEEARQEIYNYLLEQKMQEKVAAWLDELKLNSYIEIKRESS